MVHGNVEKALDLVGVQVAGHYPVGTRGVQQIRHQFGADGYPRAVLAVLARPAVVRHHGDDLIRRGPLGGIDGQQQLHQVVCGRYGGLEDIDRRAPHAFCELGLEFPIAELRHFQLSKMQFRLTGSAKLIEMFNHAAGEGFRSPARKQFHSVAVNHCFMELNKSRM